MEGKRAVGVGGDEALLDAVPGAFGGSGVGWRQVAQADALGERVGEHAARGGLEIVAVIGFGDAEADTAVRLLLHHGTAVGRLIHDLPPEAGFGVLHLEDGSHNAIERGNQRGALRVVGWEPVQYIDQGHAIPALRSSPGFRAQAGLLIRPRHGLRLVPAVAEEAGFGIAHVLVHEEELFGDVVEARWRSVDIEFGGPLESGEIGCAERLGHVGAVEPHLIGVGLLVPVAAAGGARLEGELVFEEFGGLGVLVLLGDAVEQEGGAAHFNVVEGVAGGLEAGDGSVGGDVFVDRGLDVGEVGAVCGGVPLGGHAVQQDAFFVGPLAGACRVGGTGGPLANDGGGHLLAGSGGRGGRLCGGCSGRLCGGRGGEANRQSCCCKYFHQLHGRVPLGS